MMTEEEERQYQIIYYLGHREKKIAYSKEWTRLNRKQSNLSKKQYRINHPDRVLETQRKNYKKNKVKIYARKKRNPNTVICRRRYNKEQYHSNPEYRITKVLRTRLHSALRSANVSKTMSMSYLLGCSSRHLVWYLEKNLQFGMTWENYGMHGWHIDHKRPCSAYNMADDEQQRACFHFSNLQPLWAIDNILKSDKI